MSKLHYYELCFFHDEDDDKATQGRCGYCIKTEISPVIKDDVALKILFGDSPSEYDKVLMQNLTSVMEISEAEALYDFDMGELTEKIESEYGTFYKRP